MATSHVRYKWLVSACVAVAVLPAAAHDRGDAAMDACIEAFVTDELPQGRKIEIVKRDSGSSLVSGAGPITVSVSAKGERSGRSYGSAECVVDRGGRIQEMHVHGQRSQLAGARVQRSAATRN